jgi:hypothetical protein
MTPLRKPVSEGLRLRNLSENTSDTHLRAVERFAKHYGKSPEELEAEDVRRYLLYLLEEKHDTWSTIQVNRGALKFLYRKVLKQRWCNDEIAAPKRRPRLRTRGRSRRLRRWRRQQCRCGTGRRGSWRRPVLTARPSFVAAFFAWRLADTWTG